MNAAISGDPEDRDFENVERSLNLGNAFFMARRIRERNANVPRTTRGSGGELCGSREEGIGDMVPALRGIEWLAESRAVSTVAGLPLGLHVQGEAVVGFSGYDVVASLRGRGAPNDPIAVALEKRAYGVNNVILGQHTRSVMAPNVVAMSRAGVVRRRWGRRSRAACSASYAAACAPTRTRHPRLLVCHHLWQGYA